MSPKSPAHAASTQSPIDRWGTYVSRLVEQSQRSLKAFQNHSNEMLSVVSGTRPLIDATNVCLSFYADQCQSWCDFYKTLHGEVGTPSPPFGTTPSVRPAVQKVSFRIDQLTETCEPQIITFDPSRIPGLSVEALQGPSTSTVIPAANVRLTTRGTQPSNVYVSLIDLQQLLTQATAPLPVGTYSGQVVFGSISVATVDVILTRASCP